MFENRDCCYVEMSEKDNEILKYNHREKYMEAPFIIYADLESLLERRNTCHNNPEKSSTTKINKPTPSVHLMQQKISLIIIEVKIENLGDYHDLYVQSDTLLLADVFQNFRNICIKVYAHFLSAAGLAWQTCFKKTGVELELITNVGMLLMIGKGIRGKICHAIHRYTSANNKYMIYFDENKEISYILYLDENNL